MCSLHGLESQGVLQTESGRAPDTAQASEELGKRNLTGLLLNKLTQSRKKSPSTMKSCEVHLRSD